MRKFSVPLAAVALAAVALISWKSGASGDNAPVVVVAEGGSTTTTTKTPIGEVSLNDGVHSFVHVPPDGHEQRGALVVAGTFMLRTDYATWAPGRNLPGAGRLALHVIVTDDHGLQVFEEDLDGFKPEVGVAVPFSKTYTLPPGTYNVSVQTIEEGGKLSPFVHDGKTEYNGFSGTGFTATVL